MPAPANHTHYYIRNAPNERYLYSDGANIKADFKSPQSLKKFQFEVTTEGNASTIKDRDGKYVALADGALPGSGVQSSDVAFTWRIAKVEEGFYGITHDSGNGRIAVQFLTFDTDTVSVGSHVGVKSQQWFFEIVPSKERK